MARHSTSTEGYAVSTGARPPQGKVEVDPTREDFFRAVIEKRKSLDEDGSAVPGGVGTHQDKSLKMLANAGSYGIFDEMNRDNLSESQANGVHVFSGYLAYTHETHRLEEPGEFCFPPVAAFITAAARLMMPLNKYWVVDR